MSSFICLSYERGPIRPPSESRSLLLRLVRNCPWNRCVFCPVYKTEKFSIRPVSDILSDISAIGSTVSALKELQLPPGAFDEDRFGWPAILRKYPSATEEFRSVLLWQMSPHRNIFLQDADPLIMKPFHLERILIRLKEALPETGRITAYARSTTTARLGSAILKNYAALGLARVHTGFESGDDAVLGLARKGCDVQEHIAGSVGIREAGIELSVCYMPGLGGTQRWREHALESARVLNAMKPDYIRLRTLAVVPGTPLFEMVREGRYCCLSHLQILEELELFLTGLKLDHCRIESDHMLNIVDLHGNLPRDLPEMIRGIHQLIEMPGEDRRLYFAGRRLGLFRDPEDLKDPNRRRYVESVLKEIEKSGVPFEQVLYDLAASYL